MIGSGILRIQPVLLFTLGLFNLGSAANILMLPVSANSHVVYFGQLGVGLVGEGHSVTIMAPTNARVPDFIARNGVTVHTYEGDKQQYSSSKERNSMLIQVALSDSIITRMTLMSRDISGHGSLAKSINKDCEGLLNNGKLMNMLKTFDFAILDILFPQCYYAVAYKYDLPYGTFGVPIMTDIIRIPNLPSQIPRLLTVGSDDMSFTQRLLNTFILLGQHHLLASMFGDDFSATIAPEKPFVSTSQLIQNSKLTFLFQDPVLDFPSPLMPNTVFIADIMARKALPLTNDLEVFMTHAQYGVVLVSFGSMLQEMPSELSEIVLEGLSKLKQTVIMKRVNLERTTPANLKLLDWLPQNDLLGHNKTKLFLSHCGFNSLVEAVAQRVPILCIPLAGDQQRNAFHVQNKGIGKYLTWGKFNSTQLTESLQEILNNPIYQENVIRLSDIFLDKQETPASRVSHMINHVLKFGDTHLRTKAVNLNLFQFYMLDIYLFILFCIVLASVISVCCFRLSFRFTGKLYSITRAKSKTE